LGVRGLSRHPRGYGGIKLQGSTATPNLHILGCDFVDAYDPEQCTKRYPACWNLLNMRKPDLPRMKIARSIPLILRL
jgi:hypothetical protein